MVWFLMACTGPDPAPTDVDCDGVAAADDCDDRDDDVGVARTWYADADGDGSGGEPLGEACTADGVAVPGDCDDDDPTRYAGEGCRPDPGCVHPDVATLAAVADLGVTDVVFDEGCFALLSTVLTYDEVQVVHPSGVEIATFASWLNITDLPALAIDPAGTVWVGGNTVGNAGMVGRVEDDGVQLVVEGAVTLGTSWIGVYLNRNAQSIAADGECVWTPNLSGDGTLPCVHADGTLGLTVTLPERVETVALTVDGALYASAGSTIWAIDDAGAATEAWTFDHTVLDMVFDYDGTLYVETTGNVIFRIRGEEIETFATVQHDGKLTISPDGWLVRVMPYWDGGIADIASLWEEWPLD